MTASTFECGKCEVKKVADSSVKLSLVALPKGDTRKIFSGTLIQKHHSMNSQLCDFLIKRVHKKTRRLAVIELKSRPSHPRKAAAHLQGGVDLIGNETHDSLVAILVHSRGLNSTDIKILRSLSLTLNGTRIPIRLMRSGAEFDEAS